MSTTSVANMPSQTMDTLIMTVKIETQDCSYKFNDILVKMHPETPFETLIEELARITANFAKSYNLSLNLVNDGSLVFVSDTPALLGLKDGVVLYYQATNPSYTLLDLTA